MEVKESNWLTQEIGARLMMGIQNHKIVDEMQTEFYRNFGKKVSRYALSMRVRRIRGQINAAKKRQIEESC